jgi:purine-binding chemotaxis protein CheW
MSDAEAMIAVRKPAAAEAADDAVREYLAFELSGETYALPLTCVREIVRVPEVTEVPRAPAAVLGVISVRGAVTTVLDLRIKLRLAAMPVSQKNRILLIDGGGEIRGALVDAVLQVYRLREQEVELASVLGSTAPPYLVGIGRPGTADDDESKREVSDARGTAEMLLLLDPIALLKA